MATQPPRHMTEAQKKKYLAEQKEKERLAAEEKKRQAEEAKILAEQMALQEF